MRCGARRKRLRARAFWKKTSALLAGSFLAAACGYLAYSFCLWICGFLLGALAPAAVAEAKVLVETASGEALALRAEELVAAPRSGRPRFLVPEGSRVRAGTPVVRLELPASADARETSLLLVAPRAGRVCYHPDGWEESLPPEAWERLDPAVLFARVVPRKEAPPSFVVAGAPVFKISDDLVNPCLFVKLSRTSFSSLRPGAAVDLEWQGGRGRARVRAAGEYAVLELTAGSAALPCRRRFRVRLYGGKYAGTVVPARALVRRGGRLVVVPKVPSVSVSHASRSGSPAPRPGPGARRGRSGSWR